MTTQRSEEAGLRTCPTRIDGAAVLFAHRVDRAQCQDRQRGRYHKCFTCVHNNAYSSANPRAAASAQAAAKSESALPVGVSARAG